MMAQAKTKGGLGMPEEESLRQRLIREREERLERRRKSARARPQSQPASKESDKASSDKK